MKVRIKRIDKSIPLPKYETSGAVAFDVTARTTIEIKPQSMGRVPVNIVVEIPKGYMILIKDRSSTLKKKGLLCAVGYVDQDYCGNGDEIMLQFYNPGNWPIIVERGDRLGQAAFVPITQAEWEEVDDMERDGRGGFGTTG